MMYETIVKLFYIIVLRHNTKLNYTNFKTVISASFFYKRIRLKQISGQSVIILKM